MSPCHLVIFALAIFLAVVRSRSYHEPPEWDIGTYSVIGEAIRHGRHLYSEIWDCKPPGIYVTFAASQILFGDGPLHVYALSLFAATVTMLGIYRAASIAGKSAGLWAAGFWAVMCFEPRIGGNLPNTEAFINAAVVWGFALWLSTNSKEQAERLLGKPIAIGALFAIATLFKQVAIAPAICLAVADIVTSHASRHSLRRVAIIAASAALIWLAVLGYFFITGRGAIIVQTIFVYPNFYSRGIVHNLIQSFHPDRIFPRWLVFALPAVAFAVIGLVTHKQHRGFFIALLISAHLAVAMPGPFASHYYQFWFVPLSILAGIGAANLSKLSRMRPALAHVAATLALLCILYPQLRWYRLSGDEWAREKYSGTMFSWALQATREVASMLEPNETFYSWSDEGWMYAVAHKPAPAAGLWKSHTIDGPQADWLTKRTLEDLNRNPPDIFIHWGIPIGPTDHPIFRWSQENYTPLADNSRRYWPMTVLIRKGSGLDKRLADTTRPADRP